MEDTYCMEITAHGADAPITEDAARGFSAGLIELMNQFGIKTLQITTREVLESKLVGAGGPIDKKLLN